ncbi:MAG: D-2-hydroxyacid dehydrogenase [Deltaproteobacteria bacterium]|nr:D-2-hydroxyacid dehydrogenase [Deltaproteobacteria bacterium]
MNLLISAPFAEEAKGILESKFPGLKIYAVARMAEAVDFIDSIDIMFTLGVSDDLMKRAEKLQWIQSMISGMDSILELPSLKKDIILTSARGIHGPQMSELALLLMLAFVKRFPQNMRNQDQKIWGRLEVSLLFNKKVGLLGVGAIGKEIARKCKGFGMTVYGIMSRKRDMEFVDHSFGPDGLTDVLKEVDFFINVVPSTPATKKIIKEKELSVMKPTSFFINIGRGDTVDEDALVNVLKAKKIAGAGLDVFCKEPLPKDHPLWNLDNVIIMPHMGGKSDIYMEQVLPVFEENLRRFLKGERKDLINLIEA